MPGTPVAAWPETPREDTSYGSSGNDSDMLITSAPWSVANTTPFATVAGVNSFGEFTRTGMTTAPGAAPAMPTPLPDRAAMMPAIAVPWPARSRGPSSTQPLSRQPFGSTTSEPGSTRSRPARSGWPRSTPLSSTATTAPLPVVRAQACGKCTRSRPHW
jgi:hypothetical protein